MVLAYMLDSVTGGGNGSAADVCQGRQQPVKTTELTAKTMAIRYARLVPKLIYPAKVVR